MVIYGYLWLVKVKQGPRSYFESGGGGGGGGWIVTQSGGGGGAENTFFSVTL